VAKRACDSLVKLGRNDLLPRLVEALEEPDPRAPTLQKREGKRLNMVREVVRINHHRNCVLCHAPGNTSDMPGDIETGAVPIPGEPLPLPSNGYQGSSPDILVRVDVTYLRQDFSVRLPVADAHPWPEMQRFDFLVRTRELTDDEAAAYREKLQPSQPGTLSPYHRSALAALRELSGRDTAPTAQAWREMLGLPPTRRGEAQP
jgi:hypothetical protein